MKYFVENVSTDRQSKGQKNRHTELSIKTMFTYVTMRHIRNTYNTFGIYSKENRKRATKTNFYILSKTFQNVKKHLNIEIFPQKIFLLMYKKENYNFKIITYIKMKI